MKILVLSDSHASLRFMRQCVEAVKPDMLLHLGDYYDDAQALQEEYPNVNMQQVPGNCDVHRSPIGALEILTLTVQGVRIYMTHGHRHWVKQGIGRLLKAAAEANADVVLYGHTHEAVCMKMDSGMWVMNPGSAGYGGGSAGFIRIENGAVTDCRNLRQDDLEDIR